MQKIGASSEFCAHALNSALFSVILDLVVRIRISFRGSVFPEPFCVGPTTRPPGADGQQGRQQDQEEPHLTQSAALAGSNSELRS